MSTRPDRVVVQAASRSWSGGPDLCMNPVEGRPAVAWTVEQARRTWPGVPVVIAAPAFDAGGALDALDALAGPDVRLHYSHDASPLDRLLAATADLTPEALFLRVDGLHLGWRPALAKELLERATAEGLDLAKAPDDYPIQLTADVYRVGALRRLAPLLGDNDAAWRVHPKYALLRRPELFRAARVEPIATVPLQELRELRERCRAVYRQGRLEVNAAAIPAGDQLSFHYELALARLDPGLRVLDAACGPGYGAALLAKALGKGGRVTALDLDAPTVELARASHGADNLEFRVGDVTALPFGAGEFDAVTSFETLEHVPPEPYFRELRRVLRPDGLLLLSTPQNRLGAVPVNPQHLREYSLEELLALAEPCFAPLELLGIKQGRIIFPDDPRGQNTFAVFRRRT